MTLKELTFNVKTPWWTGSLVSILKVAAKLGWEPSDRQVSKIASAIVSRTKFELVE